MSNQLKSLTMVPLPKITAADPVVHRRNKLITRLKQQIELAKDSNFTLTRQKWVEEEGVKQLRETRKKISPWWRTDATGNLVLTVRYGARPIELSKGMHAIMVGKKEKLIQTIETVIACTEGGDFDELLRQMSKTAVQIKGKRAA